MASVKDRTDELVATLCVAFGREADELLFTAYEMGLAGIPVDRLEVAVNAALRTKRFMPTVAEVRELAGEMLPEHRAVLAWDAFVDAQKHYGYYESVDFDDPYLNATVRSLGGWQRVSAIDDSKEFEVFLRREFERIYAALYRVGISSERAAPLVGYCDSTNAIAGYEVKQAVQIETGLPAPTIAPRVGSSVAGLPVRSRNLEGPRSIGEVLGGG